MSATASPNGVCEDVGTGLVGLDHSVRNASRLAATAAGATTFATSSSRTRCTAEPATSVKHSKEAAHRINRTDDAVSCEQRAVCLGRAMRSP